MDDQEILRRIHELVDEEHSLESHPGPRGLGDEEQERLRSLEIALDQCWDLLRQRRARRSAGEDPDAAVARDPRVVEGYQQ
jgi:hypothetical protein